MSVSQPRGDARAVGERGQQGVRGEGRAEGVGGGARVRARDCRGEWRGENMGEGGHTMPNAK